jgi:DNA-directed RNA polymerase specialized sigma24 family protein
LFSIARRKLLITIVRKRTLPLDLSEAAVFGLEKAVDHRLRLQQVSAALQSIEPDRVEALSLRVFGQMNTSEILRLLSRSEGAVRKPGPIGLYKTCVQSWSFENRNGGK